MNVGTHKQFQKFRDTKEGFETICNFTWACNSMNDALDNWDSLSSWDCARIADQLRLLADHIDGKQTSNGDYKTFKMGA